MANSEIKGTRIGRSYSLQSEGIEYSPRKLVEYVTASGDRFQVPFDSEAEPPAEWTDQKTGEVGYLDDRAGEEARLEAAEKDAGQRTHWDMLMERRTIPELEELLEERLRILRHRRGEE